MSNIPKRMDLRSNRLAIREENKKRQEHALRMHNYQIHRDSFEGRYARLEKIIYPGCEYCGGDHGV